MTFLKRDFLTHTHGNPKLSATAILAHCIVSTIDEGDPTFKQRFTQKLAREFIQLRDGSIPDNDGVELLEFVLELCER